MSLRKPPPARPAVLSRRPPISWPSLAVIVAIAAFVRLWLIDRDALWLDEGYSWWDARQPLSALWTRVPECDPHPPLYFATLHPWIALFGDGTVAMRSLSTLFGLATVVVVYFVGREIDLRWPGRPRRWGVAALAALLFALTPFQIYFSIEARPYALLCFGAALLTLGVLRYVGAMDDPAASAPAAIPQGRIRAALQRTPANAWWLVSVGAALMLWSNNTSVLFVGAVSVAFLGFWIFDRGSRLTLVPVVVAGALVGVLWAPDLPVLLGQMREVSEDFWIRPASFDGLTFELHNLIGLDVLRATWWIAAGALIGVVLVGRRIGLRWAFALAAMIVLPVAFNVIISVLMKPILLSRAMIGIAPAFAVALACLAMLLPGRGSRALVSVGLVVVFVLSAAKFADADHVKEPWKQVVAHLAQVPRGTNVLVVPNELELPLLHEAARAGLELKVDGVPADFPATKMNARYPSGKCAPSVVNQDLGALMSSLAGDREVILLTRLNNTYDPNEAVAAALTGAGFALRNSAVFQPGDLRVMHFARRGG